MIVFLFIYSFSHGQHTYFSCLLSRSVGSFSIHPIFHPCAVISLYSLSTLSGYLLHSIFYLSILFVSLLLLLPVLSGIMQALHFYLKLYFLSFSLLQHSSPDDIIFVLHMSYPFQSSPFSILVSPSHLRKTNCSRIYPLLYHFLFVVDRYSTAI